MALNRNIDVNFKINLIGLVLGFIVIVSENIDVLAQRRHSSRHSRRRWEDGSIRLVGGRTENEGTVLIYHWSRWGAICDDYWDIRDAHVVCNELGFPGASAAPRESMFGKGRRRVWFSGLHCRGHERHLTMCYSRGWGNSLRRCRGYWTSAGVICNPKTTTTNRRSTRRQRTTTTTSTPTTPSTTTTTNKPTTALAITRLPTTWVTTPTPTLKPTTRSTTTTTSKPTTTTTTPIPTTTTTLKPTTSTPASTATRRTTTTTKPKPTTKTTTTQQPTIVTTTRKPTTKQKVPTTKSTRRPRTTALITTTTPIQATTTATPPREYNRWIYNSELWRYFMYFSDGTHVTSRPDPRYFQRRGRSSSSSSTTTTATTTTSTTTTTTTPAPAVVDSIYNIIGGEDEHAAVDDYTRGNNNDIDNNINHLLPQTIDTEGNHVPETPYHHHHHNQIKEGYLADAPHTDNTPDTHDTVEEIEGVPDDDDKVTQAPEVPDYTEYRLAGGRVYSSFKEGRLEVRLAGSNEWGVVCGDNWDFRAAIVTCKHLGVGYARTAQTTAHYGGSDMDKVVANIKCKGSEERLEDCDIELTQNHPGHEVCSKASSVAGVICDSRLPDLTPNVTRLEQSAYLQNRYLYYLQCAFEEGCLSSSADALYKTNSWTQMTRQLLRFSTIAHNIGTADFRPDVDRSKWEWHACHQHYHSMESFSHYDIIDKHGNRVAEGLKASFCLEDSECNRGSQPKYNCQNWGQQGIAVGCADAYLADIDCQWIDVTDVKPGFYTLKVELNPNMLVPELSYDNNVAVCDLYFNTVSARLYNCKSGGLL